MKTLPKRLLTGWILAFALTGGYCWGMTLAPVNRWAMYFTDLDFWVLLGLTLAGGAILGGGAFAAEKLCPRAKPLLIASFWAWLALVLANNFPSIHHKLADRLHCPWLRGGLWWLIVHSVGGAGTVASLRRPRFQRAAARSWCFLRRVCWPVVFVVPFSVWRLPPLDAARGTGLDFAKVPGNGTPATVVLMFDMLGYEELFGETGQVRSACTNFSAFSRMADVFHAAESAGGATDTSLTGFILQSRLEAPGRELRYAFDDWLVADGTNRWRVNDFAAGSLPAMARRQGGRAQAIGMYVPWDVILPCTWNATESMAYQYGNQGVHVFGAAPAGTPSRILTAARGHAAWFFKLSSKSLLSVLLRLSGLEEWTARQGYDERVSLVARAERLLRDSLSPGDFLFIHVDMPHDPYVVGRGGKRLPVSLRKNLAGLAAQTEGADWALGVWLEAIASSPAGRGAWVVVTGDHNVHNPFFRKGPMRHVPFLVHRPGQTERRDVADPADLTDLKHVLPDLPLFAGEGGTE